MRPAVFFPREDDAITRHPGDLIVRRDLAEGAAPPRVGDPDLASRSRGGIGDADGPGLRGALRCKGQPANTGWNAQEGDALAVGRPRRLDVRISAGVEEAQRFRSDVVESDKVVIAAVAHKGEPGSIGRPFDSTQRRPTIRSKRLPRAIAGLIAIDCLVPLTGIDTNGTRDHFPVGRPSRVAGAFG